MHWPEQDVSRLISCVALERLISCAWRDSLSESERVNLILENARCRIGLFEIQ